MKLLNWCRLQQALFLLALLCRADGQLLPAPGPSSVAAAPSAVPTGTGAPQLLQLFPGNLSAVTSVGFQQFQFFFVNVLDKVDITVNLIALQGDPDLYIINPRIPNPFQDPQSMDHGWASTLSGNDSVFISRDDPNFQTASYVIAVRGYTKQTSAFQVLVDFTTASRVLIPAQRPAVQTVFAQCCNASSTARGGCQAWLELGGLQREFCTLPGNICTLDGQLEVLDLSNGDLYCKFPFAAFANFTSLKHIILSNNKLTGQLDWQTLAGLPNLEVLVAADNQFTGPITCDLASPVKPLFQMDLSDNQLSGPLPQCYLQKTNMRSLDLHNNNLTGTLPTTIPFGSQLQVVNLAQNSIGGSLVPDYGAVTNLQVIEFSYNLISGGIPTGLVGKRLDTLSLHHNQLTGLIPNDLFGASQLTSLLLNANKLSGPVPAGLAINANLIEATLQENALVGYLPSVWSSPSLVLLSLRSNQLTGSIPISLLTLPHLLVLELQNNTLNGILPDIPPGAVSQLRELNVSTNQLTGGIPNSYQSLPIFSNITKIILQGQPLPQALDVSNNKLTGTIPLWLAAEALPLLTTANVAGNALTCPPGDNQVLGGIPCGTATLTPPPTVDPSLLPSTEVAAGGSGSSASSTGSRGATAAPSLASSSGGGDSGLSGGAIAGIVLGTIAGVAILGALIALVVLKKPKDFRALSFTDFRALSFRRFDSTAGEAAQGQANVAVSNVAV